MKGKFQFSILVLVFCSIFSACMEEKPYFSVDQFTIQRGVLEDNDHVSLLYYSGHASDADEYFAQVIVVSEESGDTVNILIPGSLSIEQNDNTFSFSYQSASSAYALDIFKDNKYWKSEESALANIKKVTRDSRYDETALNAYPTCIGIIGKVIKQGDQNSERPQNP